jgi:hypothetical protein
MRIPAVCLMIAVQGCTSSSLIQSQATTPSSLKTLPLSVTLGQIEDNIACDDEAIYLRDFIRQRRSFLDWELAAPSLATNSFDTDLLIDGTIKLSASSRSFGFGKFLAVITCSAYYFLGGPTRYYTSTVDYTFTVRSQTITNGSAYAFVDQRTAYGGLYGPGIPMDTKPDIYVSGWNELIRRIASDKTLKPTP